MTNWTPDTIRGLQKALGKSNAEMATLCGVSESGWRAWIAKEDQNRHRKPSGSAQLILDRLAKRAIRREKE